MRGLTRSHLDCFPTGFPPSTHMCKLYSICERPLEFRNQYLLLSILVDALFPFEICAFALPNSLLYYTHWDFRKDIRAPSETTWEVPLIQQNKLFVWALAFVCLIFSTCFDPKAAVLSTVALDDTCVCASISYVFYVLMFLYDLQAHKIEIIYSAKFLQGKHYTDQIRKIHKIAGIFIRRQFRHKKNRSRLGKPKSFSQLVAVSWNEMRSSPTTPEPSQRCVSRSWHCH